MPLKITEQIGVIEIAATTPIIAKVIKTSARVNALFLINFLSLYVIKVIFHSLKKND